MEIAYGYLGDSYATFTILSVSKRLDKTISQSWKSISRIDEGDVNLLDRIRKLNYLSRLYNADILLASTNTACNIRPYRQHLPVIAKSI